jgi:hypothetical protein
MPKGIASTLSTQKLCELVRSGAEVALKAASDEAAALYVAARMSSVGGSLTADVSVSLRLCDAVPVDKPAFLRRDGFPANGADDSLRLPEKAEKHRRLPLIVYLLGQAKAATRPSDDCRRDSVCTQN